MAVWKDEARQEGLAEGRAEGKAEGKAEGRAEGLIEGRAEGLKDGGLARAVEDARRLKALGVKLEVIAEVTDLSEEEIRKLD